MRWQVEMTAIGKTDANSVTVEAESWQKALQTARALRGEGGPMSGFSIELLDSGYRAVDPMARLVYVVKRAADDAPLTATSTLSGVGAPKTPKTEEPKTDAASPAAAAQAQKTAPKSEPKQPKEKSEAKAPEVPPAPGSKPQRAPRPGSTPPPPMTKQNMKQTLAFGSTSAMLEAVAPKPAAAPAIPPAPTTEREIDVVVDSSPGLTPQPANAADAALANVKVSDDAATYVDKGSHPDLDALPPSPSDVPPTQVIFKREQDPAPGAPLTYREYVYAVAGGTKEDDAERVLLAQFELVRKAIEHARAGKLVNLAVFDLVFKGKPPVPPLATLAWKDWKGAPVVDFPRRKPVVRPAPAHGAPLVGEPGAAPKAPKTGAPPTALWAPPAQAAPPPPAGAPPPPSKAVPIPIPIPAGVLQEQPSFSSTAAFAPAPSPLAPNPTPGPGPTDRPSQIGRGAKQPVVRGRAKGDELITALFEAMHDLHFLRDAIEGGDFCLSLALETLPSNAAIVHLYDIDKREFVIACASGKGTEKLLVRRHPESDPILSAAMKRRRALVLSDATTNADALTERYELIGGARSVIIAPVMHGGRFIGAIEIINPDDGAPFTEDEGNALSYIAEQYAEFVAQRGIVVDAERISARPSQLRAR